MTFTVIVNNCPASTSRYIIATACEGQLWYYATWSTRDEAEAHRISDDQIIIDTQA